MLMEAFGGSETDVIETASLTVVYLLLMLVAFGLYMIHMWSKTK